MKGSSRNWIFGAAFLLACWSMAEPEVRGCPGCTPGGITLTEEMGSMDVAVVARLIKAAPAADPSRSGELPQASFEIASVLKGDALIRVGDKIQTLYLGDGKPGSAFLIMGIDPPKVMWSTPLALSQAGEEYMAQLVKLPKDGVGRYVFLQKYLEHEDGMLARDAYDEFAKASYATVSSLKEHLNYERIVALIQDPNVTATHRRLFFVMLGVCGSEKDLPMLEEMLQSTDREQRRGLDMLVFCYLAIRGEAGLPTIEKAFFESETAEYSDTYAAIMALRFHAAEKVVLKPQQVVKSLQLVLKRPELADLVIPDLARWEDWTAADELFALYKNADEKSSWVRVPVVNYLRACPLPKAKELLQECEKIDPQSVKRSHSFFPVVPAKGAPSLASAARIQIPGRTTPLYVSSGGDAAPVAYLAPVPIPDDEASTRAPGANGPANGPAAGTSSAKSGPDAAVASVNPGAAPAKALKSSPSSPPNLWQLLGVPILAGAALWLLQSSILRGKIGRG